MPIGSVAFQPVRGHFAHGLSESIVNRETSDRPDSVSRRIVILLALRNEGSGTKPASCRQGSQRCRCDRPRKRRFVLEGGFADFLRGLRFERVRVFSSRFISSRRFRAQSGLFTCRPRANASASAGTFSVSVEPAATYAPSPTRIGATSAVSLPIKTRSPMLV